jgi:hypothetical protein
MPSTYDPLLRLELQATGENATTWGVKTNTNLDLLAESIAGAVNLNVAGSGDYTLSTANGAEDEARQAILVLTGLLTGNRNIIVPSSPKNYTVINNTTGAFTVTLKQSGGSGVVIPQGSPSITVCTSTTCVDSIGATPYTKSLLISTSAEAARNTLGLANTAIIVATSVGSALITAVDTSAGRAAIEAAKSGDVTASGLTMTSLRLLGRTTSATGSIEEVSVGSGLTFTGGTLGLSPAATSQFRSQLFTSSGTWTAPSGVTQIRVTVIGGGGGGGSYNTGGGFDGGAGGYGGIAVGTYTVTPGTSYTVTVGTGGAGGAGANSVGSGGATSSFSSLISATGGGGGLTDGTLGANGSGSGGTLRNGSITFVNPGIFTGVVRGGGAGTAAVAFSASGTPGAGYGGGGGFCTSALSGAGGTGGIVYVEWAGV